MHPLLNPVLECLPTRALKTIITSFILVAYVVEVALDLHCHDGIPVSCGTHLDKISDDHQKCFIFSEDTALMSFWPHSLGGPPSPSQRGPLASFPAVGMPWLLAFVYSSLLLVEVSF